MANSVLQPYFVLSTQRYYKAIINNYGISHFYGFRKDALDSDEIIAVPDGCVDILFTCDEHFPSAEICGSVLQPKVVGYKTSTYYFGVRFYPGECIIDRAINMKEVIGNTISLTEIFDAESMIEKIVTTRDFMTQVSIFLDFYIRQLRLFHQTSDNLVFKNHMVKRMLETKGQIKVKELANEIGYTERYINQKFMDFFGLSPKLFCKIVRFQHVLSQLNTQSVIQNQNCLVDIAQNSGYYDQSHMYKDFSEFSNNSPGQYMDLLKQKNYNNRLVIVPMKAMK